MELLKLKIDATASSWTQIAPGCDSFSADGAKNNAQISRIRKSGKLAMFVFSNVPSESCVLKLFEKSAHLPVFFVGKVALSYYLCYFLSYFLHLCASFCIFFIIHN